ncbi:MAG: carboxypeptidase regulatory-like domain-containing protein [Planctomycetia bacterium]|nr:carboxypeptidase regulatory-like domain-containing protein [Planctomycetia bacterium]
MRFQSDLQSWPLSSVLIVWLAFAIAHPVTAEERAYPISTPQISARGRVVTADGQPCAGSRVVLRASSVPAVVGLIDFPDVIAETVADEQGRYMFDRVSIPATMNREIEELHHGQRGADIVVIAEGNGISWTPLYSFENAEEIAIKLEPAVTLTGVVSDADAQPLSGAEVTVLGIARFGGQIDVFLKGPDNLRLYASSLRPKTTTSTDGKIRIDQLPADCTVHLQVVHPNYQPKFFIAATSDEARAKLSIDPRSSPSREIEIQTNPVAVKLESGLRLQVRVLNHDQGELLPTSRIALMKNSREWKTLVRPDGTAAITVAEPGEYSLMLVLADGYDHLNMQQKLTLTAADVSGPRQIELQVPSPRWIDGRVVGRGTETGIGGVTVGWSVMQDDADDNGDVRFYSQTMTDLDGHFRLPAVAGKGKITLSGEVAGFFIPDYHARPYEEVKKSAIPVDVPADSESLPLRIEVSRGLVVRGSVRDADGTVVPYAVVRAASLGRYGPRYQQAASDEKGEFELAGLNPREDYELSIAAPGGVASQTVRGDKAHSMEQLREVNVELRLQAVITLSGRVLTDDKPLAKVRLELFRSRRLDDGRGAYRVIASAVTDENGRYELRGLQPGDMYNIGVHPPFPSADPAWRYQLPYLQTLATDAKGEVKLPDMRLSRLTQTLAGIVVDPDGKPVSGATVSAMLKDGGSLSSSRTVPPPRAETGADGRFRLTQLPEQPLLLMAYIRPKGPDKSIRFPARVECKLNQQDVRILLDPSLLEDE